jgi:hypothetical protein
MKMEKRKKYDDSCDDPAVNAYYASIHYMHESDHTQLRRNYFGADLPDFQPAELDLSSTCEDHYIKVSTDESADDNSDVTAIVVKGHPSKSTKRTAGIENHYSIQLFRGVEYIYGTGLSFEFSKARTADPNGENKFVFIARKGTEVVYYGDLSSTFPR